MHETALFCSIIRRPTLVSMAVVMLVMVSLLPACARETLVDTERARQLAALPYPDGIEHEADRDILVQRSGGYVRVINRSAETIEDVQLWLNRQYVSNVERIAPGEDRYFDLAGFINRYQEAFPTAGLLAPDRAATLSSAELYDAAAERRYRLVVMPEHRDQLGRR